MNATLEDKTRSRLTYIGNIYSDSSLVPYCNSPNVEGRDESAGHGNFYVASHSVGGGMPVYILLRRSSVG